MSTNTLAYEHNLRTEIATPKYEYHKVEGVASNCMHNKWSVVVVAYSERLALKEHDHCLTQSMVESTS